MKETTDNRRVTLNARWAIASLILAILLGVVICVMLSLLRDSLRAAIMFPSGTRGRGGPGTLFMIVGGVTGCLAAMLAERTWGCAAWPLLISIVASVAISVIVALVLTHAVLTPIPTSATEACVLAGVVKAISGSITVWLRSL